MSFYKAFLFLFCLNLRPNLRPICDPPSNPELALALALEDAELEVDELAEELVLELAEAELPLLALLALAEEPLALELAEEGLLEPEEPLALELAEEGLLEELDFEELEAGLVVVVALVVLVELEVVVVTGNITAVHCPLVNKCVVSTGRLLGGFIMTGVAERVIKFSQFSKACSLLSTSGPCHKSI